MRRHRKFVAWGILIGLALPTVLCGCSRTKGDVRVPLGTIYYTGPKVSKANKQHQGKMVQGQ